MRLCEGFPEGNYPLKIRVKAKSAKLHPTIEEIPIMVSKPQAEETKEEIDLPTKLKPQIQEELPKKRLYQQRKKLFKKK